MSPSEIPLYTSVLLRRALVSYEGVRLERGNVGVVAHILGPGGYVLEIAFPDDRLETGVRFEICLARAADVVPLDLRLGGQPRIDEHRLGAA